MPTNIWTGQKPNENSLELPGQLRGVLRGQQHVAVSPKDQEKKVTQVSTHMGGPIQSGYLNQQYGLQDSAPSLP
jgi:hypothetical protein